MGALGEQMGRGRRLVAAGLGDDQGGGRDPAAIAQPAQRPPHQIMTVWRIEKDQSARTPGRRGKRIGRMHDASPPGAQGGDVGAQNRERRAVMFDEGRMGGTAREDPPPTSAPMLAERARFRQSEGSRVRHGR